MEVSKKQLEKAGEREKGESRNAKNVLGSG